MERELSGKTKSMGKDIDGEDKKRVRVRVILTACQYALVVCAGPL